MAATLQKNFTEDLQDAYSDVVDSIAAIVECVVLHNAEEYAQEWGTETPSEYLAALLGTGTVEERVSHLTDSPALRHEAAAAVRSTIDLIGNIATARAAL